MLSEVPHELSTDAHSKECKRSPQQFIPAGFPPHDNIQPGTEDSGGGFRGTGHGPFRALIVSNLKWGEPCRGYYVFPAGRYQNLPQFFLKSIDGISYFPYTVALSGRDKVRPPHLTRETISGRRPADGADTPGGVFRSGENLPGEGDTADIFRRRRRECYPEGRSPER